MTDYIKNLLEFETWVNIKDYEDLYMISSWSKVKSLKRFKVPQDRILKLSVSSKVEGKGYYRLSLCKDGEQDTIGVHELLGEAFLGHARHNTESLIVHHIDEDKLNNRLDNLQVITRSDNNYEHYTLAGNKTAKHRGVHWCKTKKKFIARITIKGKSIHLGEFKDQDKASRVFKEAEIIKYNAPKEEIRELIKELKKKYKKYKK